MLTQVTFLLAVATAVFGSPTSRILNGTVAAPGDVAFMVSIRDRFNVHFCGGAIVGNNKVITSANCIAGIGQLHVYSGSVDVTGGVEHRVQTTYPHPAFAVVNSIPQNDIAVLIIQGAFANDETTARAFMPFQDVELQNTTTICSTAGWGTTSLGGGSSSVLLWTDLPIVEDMDCSDWYAGGGIMVPANSICAGDVDLGACDRDFGGPLYERGVVWGVFSWSGRCGELGRPSVFTQVSAYRDWIDAQN